MRRTVLYATPIRVGCCTWRVLATRQHDQLISFFFFPFRYGTEAEVPLAVRHVLRNVLVFSAGGYGHVPIPLIKGALAPLPPKPPAQRRYRASYLGSPHGHAPYGLRDRLGSAMRSWGQARASGGRDVFYGILDFDMGLMLVQSSQPFLSSRSINRPNPTSALRCVA